MMLRFATKTRIFSPPNSKVETAFGAHSFSYSNGDRNSIPGDNEVTCKVDHVPVHQSVFLTQYCSGDKIENEMDGECSAYGGKERRIHGFGGEN
jgi:hypothetical protein